MMFGPTTWRRYRAAKAKSACERMIGELSGRALVREAEDLVESAWIDGLDRAEHADPTVRLILERERAAFTRAARKRSAEAEKDQRRLAAAKADLVQLTRTGTQAE
ncbi:hypothetical protein KGQ20_20640 [Catenulispora sp. NF23]|uniref:Uncharacterized protein n=1 Tax=Catenulispora pinistramenti TaxID=2705254 RepID=A0ABS5L0C7_9ACTN|nr:hypothetical protein [Catenulispora pinistramenti]MBS2535175.1 hypothetical protein [Catenulispora pinistramenti]MBS2551769.1 hypothetical protein [Catenulispora pinistramenti]